MKRYITWRTNMGSKHSFQERMLPAWHLTKPYKALDLVRNVAKEGGDIWLRTPTNNIENILLDNGMLEKRNAKWNHLMPDGDPKDWANVGELLVTARSFKEIAKEYPDAPNIWICDNGESSVMKWGKRPWSSNFQKDWTVRGFANAWYELREAMNDAIRDNVPDVWKGRVRVVPYDNWRDLYYFIQKVGINHFGKFYEGVYDGCFLSAYPGDKGRLNNLAPAPDGFEEILIFGNWTPRGGSKPPTEEYLDWCIQQVKKRKTNTVCWFDTFSSKDYSKPLGDRLAKLWKDEPVDLPQPDPEPDPEPQPDPEPDGEMSEILMECKEDVLAASLLLDMANKKLDEAIKKNK